VGGGSEPDPSLGNLDKKMFKCKSHAGMPFLSSHG